MIKKKNYHLREKGNYTDFIVEEKFVGTTISVYPATVRVMSDVWESVLHADVWDEDDGKVRVIPLDYKLNKGSNSNDAVVDATDEILAKVEKYVEGNVKATEFTNRVDAFYNIEKGDKVKVVAGRKVPIGTLGVLFWTGLDHYNRHNTRAGIRDENEEVYWTSMSNLKKITDEFTLKNIIKTYKKYAYNEKVKNLIAKLEA